MSVTALQGLNDLLAKILSFAGGTKGRRWKCELEISPGWALLTVSLALQTRQGDTDETQRDIVHEFVQKRFIHDIVSYCFDKLLQIISNRFKAFVACWETIKGHSPNIAEKYGEYLELIIQMIEHFQTPGLPRVQRVGFLAVAMPLSAAVLEGRHVLEIDEAWKAAIVGASRPLPIEPSEDTADLEDEDKTDDDTMYNSERAVSANCIVLRLLAKLARYFNAGFSLVIGVLRQLARVPHTTVEKTVQESYCSIGQTQAASLRMLDDDGEDLRKKLDVPLLDEHSRQNLFANWKKAKNTGRLYVHAEVKLAMFYLANPNRHPLHGIQKALSQLRPILQVCQVDFGATLGT